MRLFHLADDPVYDVVNVVLILEEQRVERASLARQKAGDKAPVHVAGWPRPLPVHGRPPGRRKGPLTHRLHLSPVAASPNSVPLRRVQQTEGYIQVAP